MCVKYSSRSSWEKEENSSKMLLLTRLADFLQLKIRWFKYAKHSRTILLFLRKASSKKKQK